MCDVCPSSKKALTLIEKKKRKRMVVSQTFSTQDLARALVAVHVVVNAFIAESSGDWSNIGSQGRFALLVESLRTNEFGSSETYLKRLVRHYVSCIEASPTRVVEDDSSCRGRQTSFTDIPFFHDQGNYSTGPARIVLRFISYSRNWQQQRLCSISCIPST